ncbi:MAG: FG-GAP repeat protein [Deltaproteobacteria bacterium]|nr:FG-GAP repeat protein [Deltaproteobacteria bacterium]
MRRTLLYALVACTPLNAGTAPATDACDAARADCGAVPDDGPEASGDRGEQDRQDSSAADNGCEATPADAAHCGACGVACPEPVNGRATCEVGRCGYLCAEGFTAFTGACLPSGAPRQLFPRSAGLVLARRPTLRWTLGEGIDGARVALCRDRAMTSGCQTHQATGSSLRVPVSLAQGVWFWRLEGTLGGAPGASSGTVWPLVVGARDGALERDRAPSLDLDADGHDELVVGSLRDVVETVTRPGLVQLFPGGALGVGRAPSRSLRGAVTDELLGLAVTCAGDVNGDGVADLLGGSGAPPGGVSPWPGAVGVFHGGPGGIGVLPARVLRGSRHDVGALLAGVGDVNGDGYGDVALGSNLTAGASPAARVSVYRGGPPGLGAAPWQALFDTDGAGPRAVARAGDVNGDGFADVLVSAREASAGGVSHAGVVRLLLGGPAGLGAPSGVFAGSSPEERLGLPLGSVGDVNADGREDLALAAPEASPGGRRRAGLVRVHLGVPGGVSIGASRVFEGDAPDAALGAALAGVGDVNGDGYDDVALGAPGALAGAGRVLVYHGSARGLGEAPARVLEGARPGGAFGATLAGLGDANNDGYADLAVGDPGAEVAMEENVGRVLVYLGGPAGLPAAPSLVLEGRTRNGYFGRSVARVQQPGRHRRRA